MTITTTDLKKALATRRLQPPDDITLDGIVEQVNLQESCLSGAGLSGYAIASAQLTAAVLACISAGAAIISGEGADGAHRTYSRTDLDGAIRRMRETLKASGGYDCLSAVPGVRSAVVFGVGGGLCP